jgi:hypothetical protein
MFGFFTYRLWACGWASQAHLTHASSREFELNDVLERGRPASSLHPRLLAVHDQLHRFAGKAHFKFKSG